MVLSDAPERLGWGQGGGNFPDRMSTAETRSDTLRTIAIGQAALTVSYRVLRRARRSRTAVPLLFWRTGYPVPRVRIPPSPPVSYTFLGSEHHEQASLGASSLVRVGSG